MDQLSLQLAPHPRAAYCKVVGNLVVLGRVMLVADGGLEVAFGSVDLTGVTM